MCLPISGSIADGTLSFRVKYVDYGNYEELSLDCIRVLDERFSTLPRQAMLCTLAGIELTQLCWSISDCSTEIEWSPQILQWLHNLIAEKPVDLTIYHFLEENRVEVDVFVPPEAIHSSESLATLPTCIPANNITSTCKKEMNGSKISLLSTMRSLGLAVLPVNSDHTFKTVTNSSSNHWFAKCEPFPTVKKESVSHECNVNGGDKNQDGILSTINSFLEPNTLPPLLIHLDKSGEFTVIVCHIVNPESFYVYPLQESIASQFNTLCSSLHDDFSEDCIQPTHFPEYLVGDLCCVWSAQDGDWFRGIIMDVNEDHGVSKYLVHHFDHGDSIWYLSSEIKVLPEDFHCYPAQAVHCALFDVHAPGNKQLEASSIHYENDTDSEGWKKKTVERFKQLTDRPHLVAYIKSKSELFITQ